MVTTRRTRFAALDHISAPVRDIEAARAFYKAALGAIGMTINMDVSSAFGMGSGDQKIFWLTRHGKAGGGGHYAFQVDQRAEVDAFHAAALEAGGKDNGKPGPRPDYGPSYYAAFVKDPEDNNIEVVCYARAGKGDRRLAATPKPARRSRSANPKKVTGTRTSKSKSKKTRK
jgi:catechol 2,3-dioxygenase-like lactoylglutathione lyase family enzyme